MGDGGCLLRPFRSPEDYACDVGAARVALDMAKHRLAVRNAIEGIGADPLSVDVGLTEIIVDAREHTASFELRGLPRRFTTRMHAAIADILADYLCELEEE